MGKLRKASHRDVPLVSSLESGDSGGEPFVPNDFAEDGCYPVSMLIIYFVLLLFLVLLPLIYFWVVLFSLLVVSAEII